MQRERNTQLNPACLFTYDTCRGRCQKIHGDLKIRINKNRYIEHAKLWKRRHDFFNNDGRVVPVEEPISLILIEQHRIATV